MPNLAQSFVQGATAQDQMAQMAQRTQAMQLQNYQTVQKIQDNQRFAALLSHMATTEGSKPGGKPLTPTDQLMHLGLAALQAGLPQGVALLNNAIGMQYKAAEAAAAQTRAQADQTRAQVAVKKQQLATYYQKMAPAAGMLDGVGDQAGWDNFAKYMASAFNDPEYLNTPYSPQEVDKLRYQFEGAKVAIQQAHTRLDDQLKIAGLNEKQRHDQIVERAQEARAAAARVAAQASRVRAKAAQQREERLSKVGGGKTVSPPSMGLQMQAEDFIKKDFPNMDSGDTQDFAYSVASEAMALLKKNPGMDAQQALMQAYGDQKENHVLTQPGNFVQGDKQVFNPYGKDVPETFKSPQDVVKAFKAGKIPRAEAEQFLRAMGAH